MLTEIFSRSNFFFSGYFRISEDYEKSYFVYQNDSLDKEIIDVILFPIGGIAENPGQVIHKELSPGESLILDTDHVRALIGEVFEGSFFLCLQGPQFKDAVALKDLMVNWSSQSGGSFFATGPVSEMNLPINKAKKGFYMFSPIVVDASRKIRSVNVIHNHSSDPYYADTIEIVPRLSNLDGETIVGQASLIPPYGSLVIDTQEYFGKAGVDLLQKTGGYGALTAQHSGHMCTSFFFQTDERGNIICGNHTQAAMGALGGPTLLQALRDEIKKAFPLITYLRTKIWGYAID
jgi:hypothetical protein